MTSSVSNGKRDRAELSGFHALLWFCGFFGLMFVVNGFFLFYAITTFPGEDVQKSYVQGLDYNRTLGQRAAQAKLGWQAEIGLSGQYLEIRIVDSSGVGISGHDVQVQLRRLATTADDAVASAVPQGGGVYFVDISTFAQGQWEVIADVIKPGDMGTLFEARKRVAIE